jgi:hypothetical protein
VAKHPTKKYDPAAKHPLKQQGGKASNQEVRPSGKASAETARWQSIHQIETTQAVKVMASKRSIGRKQLKHPLRDRNHRHSQAER